MDLGNGLGHLTYSTLVHPGDTWAEMWDSLNRYVPQVKARVSPNNSFGVSLRLSASSAQTLTGDRGDPAQCVAQGCRGDSHVAALAERVHNDLPASDKVVDHVIRHVFDHPRRLRSFEQ